MGRKVAVLILAAILIGCWGSMAIAGGLDYTLRDAETGFTIPPPKEPTSGAVFADALIGRPLGLATTIVGGTLFLVDLPFIVGTGSASETGRLLVGRPAGWTFIRPMGRSDPRYEDKWVFPR